MSEAIAGEIDAVRRFSRFYTRTIGVLQEGFLGSTLSLTEGRVLYELGQGECVAAGLAQTLDIDPGYLSRILRAFELQGVVRRRASRIDGRQSLVALTAKGRKLFHGLDERSREEIEALIAPLAPPARRRLVASMQAIEKVIAPTGASEGLLLRAHRPGDMGFIIHRQAALYHEEYGWDETFEALVAEICAAFIKSFDPQRERCWIAELDGAVVGSVFLVRQSDEVAKLRLLYVEPEARGRGLGARLVEECIRFARDAGYTRMTLWTNDCLHAARQIYEQAGFKLVAEERHHSFGHDLVGQNWDLPL